MIQVVILGLVSFLTDISTEMVYPLIPIYLINILHANIEILGFIEGIAESSASFLKVFSGFISDRINKRKILAITGYGFSWIGKIFFYFASSWPFFFIGRLIDRIGKGIRTSPRDALIADNTPKEKRGQAYGLHRALDSLGAFLGVLIVLLIVKAGSGKINYKNIFLFSLIPAVIGWLVLFRAKEKKALKPKEVITERKKIRFSSLPKKLRYFLVFVFLFSLGNSSNQFLILRMDKQTHSLVFVLFAYLLFNLIYSALAYPFGRISDIIGQKKVLVLGYLLYGIVYWAFAIGGNYSFYLMAFSVYGIYMAVTDGVEKSLVSILAPEEIRAGSLGLYGTLVGIGILPASLIAGFLWKLIGPFATFAFGGIMGILASIGLMFVL